MIVAFTGKKQSGKTTACAYALRKLNNAIIYSFAKPLKAGVAAFFGFTDEQTDGEQKDIIDERYSVTPRTVLQIFGTEIMQEKIYDVIPELDIPKRKFWCERFRQEYKRLTKFGVKHFLIDDLRFPHEAETIKELGGIIVRINRTDLEESEDNHASEQEMDEIEQDFTVVTDGDLFKFKKKIFNLIDKYYDIRSELKR